MCRLLALAFALTLSLAARAQPVLTLGISEGTSGGLDHGRVIAKYGGLADAIGGAIKRKVQVVFAREFSALDEGMRSGRFDFVLARPSDYPARGVRDHGYQFVASARPDGQCLIITGKNSPLRELADAKGKRWVLPERVSYMSKFCAAELRDRGIVVEREQLQYVREQGAVPFYLDNGFADVGGIASYSGVARSLEKTGHRILHRSVAQPYFPLVAGKRLTAEQIRAVQAELTALPQTEAGREILKSVGVQSFDIESGERLRVLLGWLGL
ncbi:MAG: phosphate/phosphite/phosphonate ABC transporter substrate-binding protein [Piscinibacter sp.]|nr:phosphate/phosphite/phosphonate ABC transporter substrate-binding protein [Piscinibacter sp.]